MLTGSSSFYSASSGCNWGQNPKEEKMSEWLSFLCCVVILGSVALTIGAMTFLLKGGKMEEEKKWFEYRLPGSRSIIGPFLAKDRQVAWEKIKKILERYENQYQFEEWRLVEVKEPKKR